MPQQDKLIELQRIFWKINAKYELNASGLNSITVTLFSILSAASNEDNFLSSYEFFKWYGRVRGRYKVKFILRHEQQCGM